MSPATEADAALALTARKLLGIGQAAETDSALAPALALPVIVPPADLTTQLVPLAVVLETTLTPTATHASARLAPLVTVVETTLQPA